MDYSLEEKKVYLDDDKKSWVIAREYGYDKVIDFSSGDIQKTLDFLKDQIVDMGGFTVLKKKPNLNEIETWPRALVDVIFVKVLAAFRKDADQNEEEKAAKKK